MDKEFLEGLGLTPEAVEAVLSAHAQALAGMQLEHQVAMAIGKAGGKNQKAIAALLDLEALAAAEDMEAAVSSAVEVVKKENGYLFTEPTPPPFAKRAGHPDTTKSQPETLAGALRARMAGGAR